MRILPFLQTLIFLRAVSADVISLGVGTAVAGAMGYGIYSFNYIKCKYFECCEAPWIHERITQRLQREMTSSLYGQHIAIDSVMKAVNAHLGNRNPKKALAMSFHGPTGTGKNFVAGMIRNAMFKKAEKSAFAHVFVSTHHFSDPQEVGRYQNQLRNWIVGNLTNCERQLFVFDEIDKMPDGVLDAVRPFMDHYESIGSVDPRKSIYVFLSNAGATSIIKKTFDHHRAGLLRGALALNDFDDILRNSAFNEKESGLKNNEMITRHLIDWFIPFLPLERNHVESCVRDYMHHRLLSVTDERVDKIVDLLTYHPASDPIYSSSGCRQVSAKVDHIYGHESNPFHSQLDDEL
ncbi:unnamed protein product [Bursaphelenchus xylophilus]|uniref:(pine wood nematode) hypothetical protein n=1 Tax=Bursaphelenchus xylophilus TaxID=6326 RepID=A0A1I7S964_BURXY|nr:unnamed protein product [Bursaphelenchus xylophilus]CAG9086335.1 unnamed protein product [Bursaphelenchus xylophilus]